jgi:hypothetical protein
MEENSKGDKSSIVGQIIVICIIWTIVCGILECFSIHTGAIGAIMVIIPIAFLVGFFIYNFFGDL